MRRIIFVAIALLMIVSMTSCIAMERSDEDYSFDPSEIETIGLEENEDIVATEEVESNHESGEWREFLKDYEKWVDDYIAIVKKYKANPTDLSLLSDYSKMLSDMTKWSEKADNIEKSLINTEEALEYSKELLRIAGKLAEAGQ